MHYSLGTYKPEPETSNPSHKLPALVSFKDLTIMIFSLGA